MRHTRSFENGAEPVVAKVRGADAAFEWFSRAPVASVQIWVRAGASLETRKMSGAAHFLEHLLFQGRPERFGGRGIGDCVEAGGGSVNAWTSQDFTVVHATFPSDSFEEVAPALIHGVLAPDPVQEAVERERGVILQEIDREGENPGVSCARTLFDERYRGHPYGRRVLGSRESVSCMTVKDLRAFHHRFYRPSNMAVTVVGRLDRDVVFGCLDRELGAMPSVGPAPGRPEVPRARRGRAVVRQVVRDNAEAFFAMGFPIPHLFHPAVPALDCFSGLFGESGGSVLEAWRRSEALVNGVGSVSYTPIHGGTFLIRGSTHPDKLQPAVSRLREVLEDTLSAPVSEAALAAVKQDLRSSSFRMDETAQGRASRLGQEMASLGKPGFLKRYITRALALSPAEVAHTVRRFLVGPRAYVVLTGPEKALVEKPAVFKANLKDEKQVQSEGPARSVRANGLVMLNWRERSHPMVAVRVQAPGGMDRETASDNGVHALLSRLWICGCGGRDGRAVMRDFDSLGARFGGNAGYSRVSAWLEAPVGSLMPAVNLLAECLATPNLDRDDVDRERALILESIRTRVDRPQALLAREMLSRLFSGHSYGLDPLGSAESLARLGRRELRALSRRIFDPGSLVVGVVGDCDAHEVTDTLEAKLASRGSKKREPRPKRMVSTARVAAKNTGAFAEIRGPFRQSHVGLLWPGVDVFSKRLLDVKVLGSTLSMMSGPLFGVLRDELGVAYSLGAGASVLRRGGWIQVTAAVRPGTEEQSLAAMRSVVAGLAVDGSDTESLLERGREHLAGLEVLAFQRKNAVAAWMCSNEETSLGYDSFVDLPDRIRRLDVGRMIATARSLFEKEPVTVVLKPENG